MLNVYAKSVIKTIRCFRLWVKWDVMYFTKPLTMKVSFYSCAVLYHNLIMHEFGS